MDLKQAKEKLSKIDWYRQGAAVKLLTVSFPLRACFEMKIFGRKIPVKYEILVFYKDNFMENYLSKRSLESAAKHYYRKQVKDKNFIKNLFKNWHKKFVFLGNKRYF